MKKEVEYHEVTVTFVVTKREAARATGAVKSSDVRAEMASMLFNAIGDNGTNCLDAEDVKVIIDGKTELGS